MDDYIGFIYFWENLHPDAKIHNKYIGQHIGKVTDSYKGSGTIFLKRFYCKKYRNFWKRTILQTCKSIEELNEAEVFWINKYNACDDTQYCNIRPGGKNATHSQSSCLKISQALKGRKSWNKGIKGIHKASPESKQKKLESFKARFEPIRQQRREYVLELIRKKGSCKVKELAKHEGYSFKKAADTIKSLDDEGLIKILYFGTNDLRYVLPDFSVEANIISFVRDNPNCLLKDISEFIKSTFDIGFTITSNICSQLTKENKIKNTRGYRQNFYTIL